LIEFAPIGAGGQAALFVVEATLATALLHLLLGGVIMGGLW
jgi:hypothetical protein